MFHHHAQVPCCQHELHQVSYFWYVGKFNTLNILSHIRFVHFFLYSFPKFISHCFKAGERENVILANSSACSHNGSNVKSPLYCSIFGRDKRELISGRPCTAITKKSGSPWWFWLAVSDVNESDVDVRLVAGAKNLQSRMLVESAADATMVEVVPCPLLQHASASDSNEIRDCKFSPCVIDWFN